MYSSRDTGDAGGGGCVIGVEVEGGEKKHSGLLRLKVGSLSLKVAYRISNTK